MPVAESRHHVGDGRPVSRRRWQKQELLEEDVTLWQVTTDQAWTEPCWFVSCQGLSWAHGL